MKQFLTSLVVAGAVVCLSSSANASLPTDTQLSLETQEFVATDNPTDTMLAQCYNGGYAPVYRSRSYYYPRSRGGVSIQLGGGYRGFPGYYGSRYGRYGGFGPGFGPGYGFGRPGFGGPGFGRSGVGLFLSF